MGGSVNGCINSSPNRDSRNRRTLYIQAGVLPLERQGFSFFFIFLNLIPACAARHGVTAGLNNPGVRVEVAWGYVHWYEGGWSKFGFKKKAL